MHPELKKFHPFTAYHCVDRGSGDLFQIQIAILDFHRGKVSTQCQYTMEAQSSHVLKRGDKTTNENIACIQLFDKNMVLMSPFRAKLLSV